MRFGNVPGTSHMDTRHKRIAPRSLETKNETQIVEVRFRSLLPQMNHQREKSDSRNMQIIFQWAVDIEKHAPVQHVKHVEPHNDQVVYPILGCKNGSRNHPEPLAGPWVPPPTEWKRFRRQKGPRFRGGSWPSQSNHVHVAIT